MKFRVGFVSNSSSSSFILDLNQFDESFGSFIKEKILEWEKSEDNEDSYHLNITPDNIIHGFTSMNNEDSAYGFFVEYNILDKVKFGDEHVYWE